MAIERIVHTSAIPDDPEESVIEKDRKSVV